MSRVMLGSVAVAAFMAAISVLGGVVGAIVSLMAVVPGLAVVSRRTGEPKTPPQAGKEYLRWLVSTGSFAVFVACLIPLTQFPAVTLALVLLSPLFGASAYLVATALFDRPPGTCIGP